MAYKSKYLEASKKRLNGDNPNNIDKKTIDERIKRSEEEWARNRKKMAKYHTPEAKVTNRYKDARSNVEALKTNPKYAEKMYDKFYQEYQEAADDYKKLQKKEERKAVGDFLNPFDDVGYGKAFKNYRDSKANLKTAKKEEYEQKQNFNAQLLKNKTIAGYAKAIVENEELAQRYASVRSNSNLNSFDELDWKEEQYKASQKAKEAQKQLKKLNVDIDDLCKVYKQEQNEIKKQYQDWAVRKASNDNPVAMSALSVLGNMDVKSNLGAAAQTAFEGVEAGLKDEYSPVNNNTDAFASSRASQGIRNAVSEKFYRSTDNELLKKVLPEAYNIGMSMADSLIASVIPGNLGAKMLALNAGVSTANNMAERGIGASDGLSTAVLNGLAEYYGEKWSIGNLKKMTVNTLDPIVKKIAKQMIVEGSEEVFTEIANVAADTVINQDESDIMMTYNYALEKYDDKEKAKSIVKNQLVSQALEAFIGGAVSGGLFGAGGGAISKAHRNSNYKHAGELLKNDASAIRNEIDMGLNSDKKSKEHKLASQMQNKLEQSAYENQIEEYDYSALNKKDLGELRIRNSRAIFQNNVMEYVGDTKENKKVKKVINDMGKGLPVTEKQARIIRDSDIAIEAINQELNANFEKEDFTADMLTDVSNLLAMGEMEADNIAIEKFTSTNNFQPKEVNSTKLTDTFKQPRSTYINPKDCVIPATDTRINQNVGISNTRPIKKDGDNVLLLTNNGEIDYGDVDIANAETKEILDFVAQSDIIGDLGSNTIFVNYNKRNKSVSTNQYLKQAEMIYQAGSANADMSFNEYITANPIYKNVADLLGEGAQYIYNSGQTDRKSYNAVQQAKKKEKPAPSRKSTGSYTNNNNVNNGNVKYSLADNFDSEFDKAVKGDKYYKNNVFVIGKMPSLYGEFGIDTSLDLTITSKHLKNAVKPKNMNKHYHGLSKEILKNAVLKLDNPAFVSFNDNGVLYVTVSETDSDNVPISFVIKPNGTVQIEQKRVKSNHSLSIYGKENTYNFLNKQYSDNKMLSVNKNEATLIEQVLGKQFSDQLLNSDFTNNIAEYKNIVNNHSMQGDIEYSSDIEDILKVLADVTGYNYETVSDKDMANGHIVHSLAKVVINEATGKEFQTAIHENVHYVAEYNTEDYKKLKNALLDWYKNSWSNDSYKNTKFNFWRNEYRNTYNSDDNPMTDADIEEEMVADAVSALFTTDEGVQQFAEYAADKSQKEQKGIVQAFKDLVNKIVEQIKKALKKAKLTEYQQDYLQMEQQQAEHIRTLFLESLDKASENYKSDQKNNTTTNSDVKQSKKLGEFADVDINSENELSYYGIKNTANTLNDYVGIQKAVLNKLNNDNFFNKNNRNIVVNADTDIVVEISPDGIRETLSKGGRYQTLPRKNKQAKIATIRSLPELIKYAEVVELNQSNYHGNKNVGFIVLNHPVVVDNTRFDIEIKIKHSVEKNKFYIHNLTIKNEMNGAYGKGANNSKSMPLRSGVQSRDTNVSQNSEKVNNDIRFSLDVSVEEKKDLVAIHNVREDKLINALKLGGLPSPSIAIMKAKHVGNLDFGDITLLFNKDTIDPEPIKKNKVYSADAYTPTKVDIEYEVEYNKANQIYNKAIELAKKKAVNKINPVRFHPDNLTDSINRFGSVEKLIEQYADDISMKQLYLAQTDNQVQEYQKVEKKTKIVEDDQKDMFDYLAENTSDIIDSKTYLIRPWFNKYGDSFKQIVTNYYKSQFPKLTQEQINNKVDKEYPHPLDLLALARDVKKYITYGDTMTEIEDDVESANQEIDNRINQSEYEKWLNDLFNGIVKQSGIRNNVDLYTNSGNRRSFEKTHYEVTLENIVKAMNEQQAQGKAAFSNSLYGSVQTEYSSIDEIKENSHRLQNIEQQAFDEQRKEFNSRLWEIAESMSRNGNTSSVTDLLCEAVVNTKTKSGMASFIKREGEGWTNYNDSVVDDLINLVSDIRKMPTQYFEAKPQRAVYFDEVVCAVVPDNASAELKQALSDNNINFKEYAAGDKQQRVDILNSFDDVKFSKDVDSEGKKLTKEQQDFFKDSKVRDSNGKLLPVYHGSKAVRNFTVFDHHYLSRDEVQTRDMHWFSSNNQISHEYSKHDREINFKVYLNMKKPLIVDAGNSNWNDIDIKNYHFYDDFIRQNYSLDTTYDHYAFGQWCNKNNKEYNNDNFIEYIKGKKHTVTSDALAYYAKSKGYDGLIINNIVEGTQMQKSANDYVVFNSNQIKNTDNLNPTENEDIRFSKDVDFKGAFDEKEWYSYREQKRQLELKNNYDYGDRDFIRILDDKSEKIVCLETFGIDGKIEPYRVYEVGVDYNIHDEDAFNRDVIETIINYEREGYNENLTTKRLGTFQLYGRQTLFRRYDKPSVGFRILRNGTWRKPKSNVGADTKSQHNGARPSSVGGETRKQSIDVDISDYSYELLISKPDMHITTINDNVDYKAENISRKDIANKAIENAKSVGRVNSIGNAVVYVDDIDTEIIVPKTAIHHSLDRRIGVNGPIVENVGSILKNSIRINELTPRKDTIEKSYVLIGIAKNSQNEPYVVTFVVNKQTHIVKSVDVLYAVNAKTEPAGSLSPQVSTPATGSTISISDLFDYVNKYFPDILPESVLRHYGYDARPDGNIGESALYSIDVDISDYKKVLRENEKLKELNKHLKEEFEVTHGRKVDLNAAKIVAKNLKDNFDTKMTIDELAQELVAMSNEFASEENDALRNWDDLLNISRNIAQKMYDNQKKPELTEDIKTVLANIRKPRISLSITQKNSVAYVYDSYGKFRQANFGKINFVNDGIPLDTQWQEWAEIYPEWFDKNVTEPDMPLALVDIVDALRNSSDILYGFNPDEVVLNLAYDIADAYFSIPTRKTYADKKENEIKQLRKESREKLINVKAANKRKYDEALSTIKSLKKDIRDVKRQGKLAEIEARKKTRERMIESADRRKVMESIKRNMLRLSTLAKQDKKKHIPNNMIEAIRDLITSITFDNKTDIYIAEKILNLDDAFQDVIDEKDKQYDYKFLTNRYNDCIKDEVAYIRRKIRNKPVRDLSNAELIMLDDLIKISLKSINDMNKLYGQERNQTLEQSAENAMDELTVFEKTPYKDKVVIDSLKYGSMKPVYFFDYLGSDEFTNRFLELRNGEDKWAVTISNSRNYAVTVRDKHNWRDWKMKKQHKVELMNGDVIHLNTQQIMSIYAMSRREQTKNHIIHGGIVITDKPKKAIEKVVDKFTKEDKYQFNDKYNHTINEFDLAKIIGMLTDEQKAYVRDMTDYLSNEMAQKGNEVSKQLYDVELFKENNYFPARTATNYMHTSSKETIDSRKIINSGFTNATLENAENPLLLEEFDDVWASHVDEMAKYNAFAIPLENFDRVYNYQGNAGNDYVSLRTKIENIYGKAANQYIEKLLKDLNGNVIFEPGTDLVNKLVGLFKKNAVFASASVMVQQPSAIGRAVSEVDIKYFGKTTLTKRDYEEVKKYAPIAIIKDMGYFDTNMAQSTIDYLNSQEYKKFGEKFKGFITDGSYRDDVFSYTASKADEITWAHIWNACKAETMDKYSDLSNEEMLEKAGERFTEVITKTQVYDSVFSRSSLMRSKNGVVQMAMSFMAEPTTSLNMFVNTIVQAKRGNRTNKQVCAALGSLFIASVMNALLQTLVTAARDDDEDKTYAEKYLSQLLPNFIDNINPLNQIAFIKDVISLLKGYGVTRADMSVISDLITAVSYLQSDKLTVPQKIQRLAGAVGALFGIPAKNVLRDLNGVYNIVKGIKSGNSFSRNATGEALKDEVLDVLVTDDLLNLFGLDPFPEKDKAQKIYEAVFDGDKELYRRLADNLDNPDTYVKNGLIANDIRVAEAGIKYAAGDISALITTAETLEKDGFDYEIALNSIKGYVSSMKTAKGQKNEADEEGYANTLDKLLASGIDKEELETAIDGIEIAEKEDKESKLYNSDDLQKAVESGNQDIIDTIIQSNIDVDVANGKTEDEARKTVKSSLTTIYKQNYIESDENERIDIENKLLSTDLFDNTDYTDWKAEAYNTEAMAKAFSSNDTATIKKYVSDRVKAKVENGMDEKNAVFGIKTSISNQYKQKFINGNADTKAEIITIMTKTGIYGSRTDVIVYINKYWLD